MQFQKERKSISVTIFNGIKNEKSKNDTTRQKSNY